MKLNLTVNYFETDVLTIYESSS